MLVMEDDWWSVNVKCGENELCSRTKTPTDHDPGITTKKNDNNAEGFVRYTHELKGGTFTLKGDLDGDEELSARHEIQNVTSVSALCWVDELATPLLLEANIARCRWASLIKRNMSCD